MSVPTLIGGSSKSVEIEWLRALVASLPKDSYLASILGNCAGGIEQAIRDDFGFIDYSARYDEQRQHRAELAALKSEESEQLANLADAKRQYAAARRQLDSARIEAQNLATALARV